MGHLNVVYLPLNQLVPDPGNARVHSDKQVEKIAVSIRRFGFNNPLLIDADGRILCGHGRFRAAGKLGLNELPTLRLDHLSAAQRRAYMLADNRTAEDARWEPELLAAELRHLIEFDLEFEITDTGFEMAEIDQLLL